MKNHYINLGKSTYIKKILQDKNLVSDYIEYNRKIETAIELDKKTLLETETKFEFTYRQSTRKLLYAMKIWRPDISFPLIKLGQYSTKSVLIHVEVVPWIDTYLEQTHDEGIYCLRKESRAIRPICSFLKCTHSNDYIANTRQWEEPNTLRATVYSDYTNIIAHRK